MIGSPFFESWSIFEPTHAKITSYSCKNMAKITKNDDDDGDDLGLRAHRLLGHMATRNELSAYAIIKFKHALKCSIKSQKCLNLIRA